MKKIWKYAILLVALSALLCMSAFAAEDLPVFEAAGEVTGVTTEMQADKFTLTYTKTGLSGECLILMITQEEVAAASEEPQYTINENTIQYVNQDAAAEGSVSFNIYPKEMVDAVILMASKDGIQKLGTVKAPEKAGVTVNGTIAAHATGKDTWLSGDTTVTLTKKGEATALQTVTLTTDKGISVSNGASAETVSFDAVENGTYIVKVAKAHFAPIEVEVTVNGTAVTLDNIDLYMWGDVDYSSTVDMLDAFLIFDCTDPFSGVVLTGQALVLADVDADNSVTMLDAFFVFDYTDPFSGVTEFPADK